MRFTAPLLALVAVSQAVESKSWSDEKAWTEGRTPGIFDSTAPDTRSFEHTNSDYDPRKPEYMNLRDPRSHSHTVLEDVRDYGHQVVIDPRDPMHDQTKIGMAATEVPDVRDPSHSWTQTGVAYDTIIDPRDPMQYTEREVIDPRDPMQYTPREVIDQRDPMHITAPLFKKRRFVDQRDPIHYEPPKHQPWQPVFNSTWELEDATRDAAAAAAEGDVAATETAALLVHQIKEHLHPIHRETMEYATIENTAAYMAHKVREAQIRVARQAVLDDIRAHFRN